MRAATARRARTMTPARPAIASTGSVAAAGTLADSSVGERLVVERRELRAEHAVVEGGDLRDLGDQLVDLRARTAPAGSGSRYACSFGMSAADSWLWVASRSGLKRGSACWMRTARLRIFWICPWSSRT